jgi:hypothetical protein
MDFTDLFLLIGTNPLPNYVTAKFFVDTNPNLKRIWLIYSDKTKFQDSTLEYAENIEKILKQNITKPVEFPAYISLSDIGSAKKIVDDLRTSMTYKAIPYGTKLHLNYTGGTKAMAVHVYRYFYETYQNMTSSYLDGREYVLKDNYGEIPAYDLREKVGISLENIIKLHGYIKNSSKYKDTHNENNKDNEESVDALEEKLFDKKTVNKGNVLEDYVYAVIKQGITNDRILLEKFNSGLITLNKRWYIRKSGVAKSFELDVIITNGYQLCPISCVTSSDEGKCKNKGFEVYHRSQQIGGDESKKILITGLKEDAKNAFKRDLETFFGFGESDFLVLSEKDLKRDLLWKKIKDHIWG